MANKSEKRQTNPKKGNPRGKIAGFSQRIGLTMGNNRVTQTGSEA